VWCFLLPAGLRNACPQDPQLDPNSVAFESQTNPTGFRAEWSWTEGWLRADVGAANGHGNARTVARLH
jgi:hypothetical protein